MPPPIPSLLAWPFEPSNGRLLPRWIVLRGLALIYFSAFYSCAFQVQGLIGPSWILPANEFLRTLTEHFGPER